MGGCYERKEIAVWRKHLENQLQSSANCGTAMF
jgi:hypothetical protein